MGVITEAHNRMQNQTTLFVPPEALSAPIDLVSKDKDLCARLEGMTFVQITLTWISQ